MMTISVVIPTYRRSKDLERCLKALKQQTRQANEVLVIVRDTDTETWEFLEKNFNHFCPFQCVKVTIPGQVAALNTGLDAAFGDIIAITDDDAAPHPQWLARIESHFLSDDKIGGVGGRDYIYEETQFRDLNIPLVKPQLVGKVQWFGRVVGNHHIGSETICEVDILKGANMSYRRSAIKDQYFDDRLRGTGAQAHNDLAFSLAVRRKGWKLIYDPLVAVDHYPGQRFDQDKRGEFNALAMANRVHNKTLTLLEHLPSDQRFIFLIWAVLIGTRGELGLIQLLRFIPTQRQLARKKWLASMQGRWQGWQTWQQTDQSI